MKTLWEVYKGHNIYFDWAKGQFFTENGYYSYVQSSARYAAVNGL